MSLMIPSNGGWIPRQLERIELHDRRNAVEHQAPPRALPRKHTF